MKRKRLKVESVEEKEVMYGNMVKFRSDGDNYSFFSTKRDGSETKAHKQWKKYGFGTGDIVEVNFKEEEKVVEGNSFTQRTVMFFGEVENMPSVSRDEPKEEPEPPQSQPQFQPQPQPEPERESQSQPQQDKIMKALRKIWEKLDELEESIKKVKPSLDDPGVKERNSIDKW